MNVSLLTLPAYVGPGAGFAFFSTALLLAASVLIVLVAFVAVPLRWTRKLMRTLVPVRSVRWLLYVGLTGVVLWYAASLAYGWYAGRDHPRMVVLGMDGIDPGIVRTMMDRGELPNFRRLRQRGTVTDLEVPNPPISPTSWASFITGANPGRHGIFGFIGRAPETYTPRLFTEVRAARSFLGLPANLALPGPYRIPLAPPDIHSHRQGTAFWDVTSSHGIESTMIRVPVTFPPEPVEGKMLSGLGTPDLRGTQGSYSLWAERPPEDARGAAGEIQRVRFIRGEAGAEIRGPRNTLLDRPEPIRVEMTLRRTDTGAEVSIPSEPTFTLRENDWSEWKKLVFPTGIGFRVPGLADLRMTSSGVARFHLNDTDPFELYMTPIQINPKEPDLPISHPASYASKLAKRLGYFYTMGMAQDDAALKEESIGDTTFMEQVTQGMRERRRILSLELHRQGNGLIVGVFDTTDRVQHLMWRHRDEDHPLHDPETARLHADVIPMVYRKMDEILGEVLDGVDRTTPVLVVSDHGFTSFRRQFHVNDWLKREGYLEVNRTRPRNRGRFFRQRRGRGHWVDWDRTRAYQLGLTGVYLNLEGREGNGSVPPERRWELAREIKRKLEAETDPRSGRSILKNVRLSRSAYEGLYWHDGPDLILGYDRGYRTSWPSARGSLYGEGVVSDNRNKWSGDHVMDSSLVPGILASSVPLDRSDPHITDVAATVLNYYDVPVPETVDGKPLFDRKNP